jgi:hypothetical protein
MRPGFMRIALHVSLTPLAGSVGELDRFSKLTPIVEAALAVAILDGYPFAVRRARLCLATELALTSAAARSSVQ